MIRRATAGVVTLVVMLSACASRQPTAGRGSVLKGRNFILAPVYALPHGQMFAMTAAALQAQGFVVEMRDSAETKGYLRTAPRFTAPSCFKPEVRAEVEQLGLGLVVMARTVHQHDSTEVGITSVVVRRNPIVAAQRDRADELDEMLRICGCAFVKIQLDSLARPTT